VTYFDSSPEEQYTLLGKRPGGVSKLLKGLGWAGTRKSSQTQRRTRGSCTRATSNLPQWMAPPTWVAITFRNLDWYPRDSQRTRVPRPVGPDLHIVTSSGQDSMTTLGSRSTGVLPIVAFQRSSLMAEYGRLTCPLSRIKISTGFLRRSVAGYRGPGMHRLGRGAFRKTPDGALTEKTCSRRVPSSSHKL
jgi:hypothetical protein